MTHQKPSKYQSDIYDFVENDTRNAIINAVAGSGKTTTIINSLDYLKGGQDTIFLAFNKSIVESLKERVKKGVDVSTFHSLGFSNVIRAFGNTKVQEHKIKEIIYANLKRFGVLKKNEKSFAYQIQKLVDFIRLNNCSNDPQKIFDLIDKHGIMVVNDEIDKALEVLRISNNRSEVDFVDMLYRPIYEDLKMKKYDMIYVDESQDLSIVQQHLFQKIMKPNGRFIAVGDPSQAIYGFAGSDFESFNNLKGFDNTIELPLSVCYRCGKNIVRYAQDLVPHIEAYAGSIDGVVRDGKESEIRTGDWVLCRNTKPLFIMCLSLFKSRKSAYIKGHDFGNDLIELLKKTNTEVLPLAKVRLNHVLDKTYDKLRSYGIEEPEKTNTYNSLLEKIDILISVIFPEVRTVAEAIKMIETFFNEKKGEKRITLSTIHRAKGFESDRVFVLKRELIPSKFATKLWELEQERNLAYVCYTRAKKELIFLKDKE